MIMYNWTAEQYVYNIGCKTQTVTRDNNRINTEANCGSDCYLLLLKFFWPRAQYKEIVEPINKNEVERHEVEKYWSLKNQSTRAHYTKRMTRRNRSFVYNEC